MVRTFTQTNDFLYRPWEAMKNAHKGPMRHYGMGDDSTDDTLVDDSSGNSGPQLTQADASVINSLITTAGNVASLKAGGVVLKPLPGQVVSANSANAILGMNTTTMLMLGAAAVALVMLMKK
jgi:hypothetical protein